MTLKHSLALGFVTAALSFNAAAKVTASGAFSLSVEKYTRLPSSMRLYVFFKVGLAIHMHSCIEYTARGDPPSSESLRSLQITRRVLSRVK